MIKEYYIIYVIYNICLCVYFYTSLTNNRYINTHTGIILLLDYSMYR